MVYLIKYRTRHLYYMYSAFVFTELVGPQFSRWATNITIWLALGIGLAFLLACFPVLYFMPESTEPLTDDENSPPLRYHDGEQRIWTSLSKALYDRLSSISLLFQSRNMGFAIPMFFVGTFRNISIRALIQYASMHLHWKLSDVSNNDCFHEPREGY